MNDNTFEETFALKLTPLGLFTLIAATTIIFTVLVISLVAFTSLREYIPGFGNVQEKNLLIELTVKVDSLEQAMSAKDWYIKNIANVLQGKTEGKSEKPKKTQLLIILDLKFLLTPKIHN